MDIVLIPGLWLDGSAWDDVLPELEKLGHRGIPVTLPGQGDGASTASYDDQAGAVLAAIDAAEGAPLVVGHSAASTLAWVGADRRPDEVAGVVLIGGFPTTGARRTPTSSSPTATGCRSPAGSPSPDPTPTTCRPELKAEVAAGAHPVPVGVTKGIVQWTDERRHDVPLTLVCPEFSPAQAREWIESGDVPELAAARKLELVDIESGHWPMFTQPAALAALLDEAALRRSLTNNSCQGHGGSMQDVEVIEDAEAAAAAMDPIRARLLGELAVPASAAGLAARVGIARQKVNYHLKALEAHGLVTLSEERRHGGLTERVLQASAASYVMSPAAVTASAADPDANADHLSAAYLVALAGRVVREVGALTRRADTSGTRLPTLTIDTRIGFRSAADRAAFADDLTAAVLDLAARYHHDDGRPHRLVVASHPLPEEST